MGGPPIVSHFQELERDSLPVLLEGKALTERIRGLIDPANLPCDSFTVEVWLKDHVDQSVVELALIAA